MSKVFNMVGGGGGPAASIFVTGLSETDTVTATKGSKTLTGKWTQKPNPLAHGLPDGYTELEYIESTGTQYIDTGAQFLSGSGRIKTKFIFTEYSANLFGSYNSNSESDIRLWVKDASTTQFRFGSTNVGTPKLYTGNEYNLDITCDNGSYTIDANGSTSSGSYNGSINNGLTFYLFSQNFTTVNIAKCRFYFCQMWDSSTLIRDFIPAKRKSDSAIGMYDLVSGTFFENDGTGEFVAGAEIPQTIDGFLIKPIRELGTWTVTATDGVDTLTQDVLVDVITNYEIEMSLSTAWLYRNGDEYEDVTGGWTSSGYTNNSVTMQGGEKRSNSLYFVNTGTDNYVGFGTDNTVNLNSVNFIKVEVVSGSFGGYDALLLTKSKTNYAVSANEVKELRLTDTGTFALDVSEITTSVYIMLRCGAGTTLEIGKVWLEK